MRRCRSVPAWFLRNRGKGRVHSPRRASSPRPAGQSRDAQCASRFRTYLSWCHRKITIALGSRKRLYNRDPQLSRGRRNLPSLKSTSVIQLSAKFGGQSGGESAKFMTLGTTVVWNVYLSSPPTRWRSSALNTSPPEPMVRSDTNRALRPRDLGVITGLAAVGAALIVVLDLAEAQHPVHQIRVWRRDQQSRSPRAGPGSVATARLADAGQR